MYTINVNYLYVSMLFIYTTSQRGNDYKINYFFCRTHPIVKPLPAEPCAERPQTNGPHLARRVLGTLARQPKKSPRLVAPSPPLYV